MGMDFVVAEINDFIGLGFGSFLSYFSILKHFGNLERGILDLRDLVYFASMTALALILNYIAVEKSKY
jgi:hypothetical protein